MQNNPEIEQIIESAVHLARGKEHKYVLTEHLMLSLLTHAPFAAVLTKFGVNLPDMIQAGLDVLQRHTNVVAQTGFGDVTAGDGQQIGGADVDLRYAFDLVVAAKGPIEDSLDCADQAGMRHPRAVEALVGLALFVGGYVFQSLLVGCRVVTARNDGRHAAEGVCAAFVAGSSD